MLFKSGDHGSKYYRIPALVTTEEGTLIAVADRRNDSQADLPNFIDIVARRSTDNGKTWSETMEWKDLYDPACNGDIMRYPSVNDGARRDRLLHFVPFDKESRCNVSVAVSYDEGRTWPVKRCVWDCDAGYSSITRMKDGSIGLLTEVGNWDTGFEIVFTRLTFGWLTCGKG